MADNYSTKNPSMKDAETMLFALSSKAGSAKQITVDLGSKKYKYLCRFPVNENDCVIIGNDYEAMSSMATTGAMGKVVQVEPKVTIKRSHAAEIDFVCTPCVDKKLISANVKYLATKADNKTLRYDRPRGDIHPITYMTRKVLAASSVLAFPKLASSADCDAAKACIQEKHILSDEIFDLENDGFFNAPIEIDDVQAPLLDEELKAFEGTEMFEKLYADFDESFPDGRVVHDETLDSYINKAVNVSAAGIMIRGGFVNLLQAYLSASPDIADVLPDLIKCAQKLKSNKCAEILEAYEKELA